MEKPGDQSRRGVRDEVQAIFADAAANATDRECPRCGVSSHTASDRCPACGSLYAWRPPRLSRRRRALLAGVGLGALSLIAVFAVPAIRESHKETSARADAAQEQRIAAHIALLRRLQAPHRGRPTDLRPPSPGAGDRELVAARAALVADLELTITRDARARERAGELDGPIRRTECGPFRRSRDSVALDHEDLSKRIGRYDCIAVKADVPARGQIVGQLGHPFVATVDFERFTYVWCRNTPAQGERGEDLAKARLDRACLGATGRPIGTGYLEDPRDG